MPVGRSFMFGGHMGAGCGFAPAKYHFVPLFFCFFFPLPTPLLYICQEHESNTALRSSFGVHIVFRRACGSNQALRKFKKRAGVGGDQLGLALRKISSATVSLRLLCEGIPHISFLPPRPPRSPVPPSSFCRASLPAFLSCCDPEGSP